MFADEINWMKSYLLKRVPGFGLERSTMSVTDTVLFFM